MKARDGTPADSRPNRRANVVIDRPFAMRHFVCSVFLVPGDARKNEQDHVCMLNSVARSIVERCRGKHPTAVFAYRGRPLCSVNNTAWLNARASAVAKYEERLGEPSPEGLERCTCTICGTRSGGGCGQPE